MFGLIFIVSNYDNECIAVSWITEQTTPRSYTLFVYLFAILNGIGCDMPTGDALVSKHLVLSYLGFAFN